MKWTAHCDLLLFLFSKRKLFLTFIKQSPKNQKKKQKLQHRQGSVLSLLLSKLICGYERAALWLCIILDKLFSLLLVFQTDCSYYCYSCCCCAAITPSQLPAEKYKVRLENVRSEFICAKANTIWANWNSEKSATSDNFNAHTHS